MEKLEVPPEMTCPRCGYTNSCALIQAGLVEGDEICCDQCNGRFMVVADGLQYRGQYAPIGGGGETL